MEVEILVGAENWHKMLRKSGIARRINYCRDLGLQIRGLISGDLKITTQTNITTTSSLESQKLEKINMRSNPICSKQAVIIIYQMIPKYQSARSSQVTTFECFSLLHPSKSTQSIEDCSLVSLGSQKQAIYRMTLIDKCTWIMAERLSQPLIRLACRPIRTILLIATQQMHWVRHSTFRWIESVLLWPSITTKLSSKTLLIFLNSKIIKDLSHILQNLRGNL